MSIIDYVKEHSKFTENIYSADARDYVSFYGRSPYWIIEIWPDTMHFSFYGFSMILYDDI